MASLKTPAVISAQWLQKSLTTSSRNLKVLDTSWAFDSTRHTDYVKQHIPTAQHWVSQEVEPATRYIPRSVPTSEGFTKYACAHGIDPDTHVVVYDQDMQFNSARTWWNFRVFGHQHVSVLDGGLKQWMDNGGLIEEGENTADKTGTFAANYQQRFIVDYDAIQARMRENSVQLLDTREPIHFRGQAQEPNQFTAAGLQCNNFPLPAKMACGHVPGSLNLLVETVVDAESRMFKSAEDIKAALQSRGVDLNLPIAASCYSGIMACIYSVAAAHAKLPDIAVYPGSWSEFGIRAEEDNLHVSSTPDVAPDVAPHVAA